MTTLNGDIKRFAASANTDSKVAEDAQEKTLVLQDAATGGGFDNAATRVAELATNLASASAATATARTTNVMLLHQAHSTLDYVTRC